jgi:hypothetical protein
MPLTKKAQWTIAFHDFLWTRANTPFRWGSQDCCLFAADALLAITGTDIADDFRGKYTDERSAFSLIRTITGGSGTADAVVYAAAKHGLVERAHPLLAQRGDLVLIANGGTLIAGVVHLCGSDVVSVSETGPVRLPVTAITRRWSY